MPRVHEMAARRSLHRTVAKFSPAIVARPVAIISAFQGGKSLADNRRANAQLAADLQSLGFGFYSVEGAGQESRWLLGMLHYVIPSCEESFVVQPRDKMMNHEEFEVAIQRLVTKYGQYGAAVKLPSSAQAFILRQHGRGQNMGSRARPTTVADDYYTQLKRGPRAEPNMLRPWEIRGERNPFRQFINWWRRNSFMNRPANRAKIGRRLSIKNLIPPQALEER